MKKRLLAMALALVMALALLPGTVLAAEYTVVEITPCKYSEIADVHRGFSEGLADVCVGGDSTWSVGGQCGYIDRTGREVIPPLPYDRAENFSEGLAVVGVFDSWTTLGYTPWPLFKWGYIDKTGKEVIPCKYDVASTFSEGLAAVRIGAIGKSGQWGFIDKTGKEVIPFRYFLVEPFSEGLAAVKPYNQWGFIDKTGQVVISCKYDDVDSFSDGLARVKLNGKWGFIDQTGQEVIPCKYDEIEPFSEGLASVKLNGKWGFIDQTGQEVIPCKYDYAYSFSDGLAAVSLNGKYGFIDKTGQEVIPCQYRYVQSFSDGLALVTTNVKIVFIDKTGQEVILDKSDKYIEIRDFNHGLAVADGSDEAGHRWSGIIDKTGREVVPCRYDQISHFDEDIWAVNLNGKWGFISINGNTAPAANMAYPSIQTMNVDGTPVEFAMYALNGGSTNYIRVRDLAAVLNGTSAQFSVGWDGYVTLTSKTRYDGSADKAPFTTPMAYTDYTAPTYVNGKAASLEAIQIEYNGGGFTYYKLRDLGEALGFNVGWSADKGIFVETDKPYDANS